MKSTIYKIKYYRQWTVGKKKPRTGMVCNNANNRIKTSVVEKQNKNRMKIKTFRFDLDQVWKTEN